MKRIILAANTAFLITLAACEPGSLSSLPPTPRDAAAATIVDEKAIKLLADTVNATALGLSAAVKLGNQVPGSPLKTGSPLALKLATLLDTARDGVNAAAAARTSGSYIEALAIVRDAMASVQVELAAIGS